MAAVRPLGAAAHIMKRIGLKAAAKLALPSPAVR
jgi:hypothetical protein